MEHTLAIPPEKMEAYRQAVRLRDLARQEQLQQRHQQAWQIAEKGAHLLKEQYGAEKVAAFGSLVHPDLFFERSDIDLAVWGIPENVYLRALANLMDLTTEFAIDLVRVEEARLSIKAAIDQEGVLL